MIESYFKCLAELDTIKNEMGEIISLYIKDKNLNVNVSVMEVILLYFVIDNKGSCYPRDLDLVTRQIATNNTYNIKNLVKKGFLINEKSDPVGFDGRRHRLIITKNGRKLYEGLSDYIIDKFKQKNKSFEGLEINMFDPILREIVYLRHNIS